MAKKTQDPNQITVDSILNPEIEKIIKREANDLSAQQREKPAKNERLAWMGNPQPMFNDAGKEISIENGYSPADLEEMSREM